MRAIRDVRLRIQCQKDQNHAKILPISGFLQGAPGIGKELSKSQALDHALKLYIAQCVGEIICGKSSRFIYKPSTGSPIGRCALCGGALTFEVQDFSKDGESAV